MRKNSILNVQWSPPNSAAITFRAHTQKQSYTDFIYRLLFRLKSKQCCSVPKMELTFHHQNWCLQKYSLHEELLGEKRSWLIWVNWTIKHFSKNKTYHFMSIFLPQLHSLHFLSTCCILPTLQHLLTDVRLNTGNMKWNSNTISLCDSRLHECVCMCGAILLQMDNKAICFWIL